MTRRRWVASALGLVLAIWVVVWVTALVSGPIVECVDSDPAICDRLRSEVDHGSLLPLSGIDHFFLPVTKIRVWDDGCQNSLEWAWGILSQIAIC